jgi:RNA recognition motif. (a.k.a. RRM, RBD, or RNP domain)
MAHFLGFLILWAGHGTVVRLEPDAAELRTQLFSSSPGSVDALAFDIGIRNARTAPARRRNMLNIYVGNLNFDTSENDLQAAFATYGTVSAARVPTDRDTGRARGFGFVEMANDAEGQAAIRGLNGSELQGRTLTVNQAKPRDERRPNQDRGYAPQRSRW